MCGTDQTDSSIMPKWLKMYHWSMSDLVSHILQVIREETRSRPNAQAHYRTNRRETHDRRLYPSQEERQSNNTERKSYKRTPFFSFSFYVATLWSTYNYWDWSVWWAMGVKCCQDGAMRERHALINLLTSLSLQILLRWTVTPSWNPGSDTPVCRSL